MEDRDRSASDNDSNKSKKWLVPLILTLALLALLGWFLTRDSKEASTSTAIGNETSQTENASTDQPIKDKFAAQFNLQARTLLFNPDTTELQDETATTASLNSIVEFYKANSGTKLTVNGSIFDGDEVDSQSSLAKQRAELIKQRLTAQGVNETDITVSTINNYEGQDEAARAEYARSVVISAE